MRAPRLTFLSLLCLLFAVPNLGAAPRSSIFYVATNGNDQWWGTLAAPNKARTDGPFASLPGARDALRRVRSASELGGVTVRIRGGVYILQAPFVLEPSDSGSSNAPVAFEAFPGERPVLSGGAVITGFRQNGPLWEATIPEVKSNGWYFRQLFVNGSRRQLARSPNKGFHRIAGLIRGPAVPNAKPVARDRFVFSPGDVQKWDRLSDAYVVLMHSWETSMHPIKSVDAISDIVEFAVPLKEWWGLGFWEEAQRYYIENARELLDEPGEWYVNRETGLLSYWPLPGERIDKISVVAPRLTELVRFAGNAEENRLVRHVKLRGLSFHYADWVLDPKGNSSTQAAVEVPAVVTADGAIDCAVEQCEVAHIGTYAVWFRRGCKDCRIQQNRLFDLGAGGIRVGEAAAAKTDAAESSRTLVDNNHIYDGGHVFAAGIGIWVAQSSSNVISHNDIHDLLYSSMSIGWNWDDSPNRTHHNIIEYNHVHDLCHGVLSDAGLIYCLGVSPGSVIRNNIFHDIWPYRNPPFGWGIYLDATCGQYLVESNLVYNTRSGGLMYNNGGHEHVIRNNIFALSADYALWPFFEKRPDTFVHNIVYLTQGELFVPHAERSFKNRVAAGESLGTWDSNVYWDTRGPEHLKFLRQGFPEWQQKGLDLKSRIIDPGFLDPRKGDFRLTRKSPALQLGFRPLQLEAAGLYGESRWAGECRHRDCPLNPLPQPPPPPKPFALNDDFETTPVGSHPLQAQVSGEEHGASIRVTEERAASGKRSLKITDSGTLQPAWQPHFYYEPHYLEGTARESFNVWLATNAQFFTEWRDAGDYPRNVGPSVLFDGTGNVSVGGKVLAHVPPETWLHVEIEAPLGAQAARAFSLTLRPAGREVQRFNHLTFPGVEFRQLQWLGFSSTAQVDTAFYLDDLAITAVPP